MSKKWLMSWRYLVVWQFVHSRFAVLRDGDAVHGAPIGDGHRFRGQTPTALRPAPAHPVRQRRRLPPLHRHDHRQPVS